MSSVITALSAALLQGHSQEAYNEMVGIGHLAVAVTVLAAHIDPVEVPYWHGVQQTRRYCHNAVVLSLMRMLLYVSSPGTPPRVRRRFLENVELWAFRGDTEAYDARMEDLLARSHGPLSPVPATMRDR